ncbi:MAG: chitobiase/beta-hexosaminidase C-terminal domain-containing protein, partial [Bacteroidota bacterium]
MSQTQMYPFQKVFPLFILLLCSSWLYAQDNFYVASIQSSIDNYLGDVEENIAGEIYSNSSDLEMVFDGGNQLVGMRFKGIELPQGAQIQHAYIQFSVDEVNTAACNLEFRIEIEDQATAFEERDNNLSGRNFSTNAVRWSVNPWTREFDRGELQRSPDLTSLLQEVINRDGWQNGNAVVFQVSGSGQRTAISYDRDPSLAPQLIIGANIPIADELMSELYVNELMASTNRVLDEQGEPADWVEIYNGSDRSQNIGGLYLTDDLSDLRKWRLLAPIEIEAGGHSLIWLDGEVEQGSRHASFKLDKDGEDLALVQVLDGQEIILDQITFPELDLNVSYGRQMDGADTWIKFSEYSPGESNDGNGRFLDANISFSQEGGIFPSTQSISMQSSDPDAQIYYTLDGQEPDTDDLLYSSPVSISQTSLLRARAFKTGFAGGEVKSETYFINERHQLPILNIQTEPEHLYDDESGIYVAGTNGITGFCVNEPRNWNQDWERPIHLSLFETDGTEAFSVNAGMKIGGGCSRGNKMKSLNFYFRGSLYGDAKVEYQVFPQLDIDEFNRLKIRNSGNDFVQMGFRDGAIQSMLYNTIDIDIMAYRPVVAYINGEFWGIYGLRELFNEDYIASHHEVDEDELDVLSNPYGGGEINEGDRIAFEELQNFIRDNDLSIPANYEQVEEQIDINEFLNYYIVQIYIANYDW